MIAEGAVDSGVVTPSRTIQRSVDDTLIGTAVDGSTVERAHVAESTVEDAYVAQGTVERSIFEDGPVSLRLRAAAVTPRDEPK